MISLSIGNERDPINQIVEMHVGRTSSSIGLHFLDIQSFTSVCRIHKCLYGIVRAHEICYIYGLERAHNAVWAQTRSVQ